MIDYLIPPVLGALIGYFTNYVAIKMLFRPYRAYYVFGRKVPFTPGLIPSKREKLAGAIARVVKENLVTEEAIRSRLNEEEVKKSLLSFVESAISTFENRSEEIVYEFLKNLEGKNLAVVINVSEIEGKAEKLVLFVSSEINGKKIEELIPPRFFGEVEKFLDEKVDELTEVLIRESEKPEFRDLVYSFVKTNVDRIRKVLPIFSEEVSVSISHKVSEYVLSLIEKVSQSPEFKAKVSKLLWAKVREVLKKEINTESELWKRIEGILIEAAKEVLKNLLCRNLSEGELKTFSREFSSFVNAFLKKYRREIAEKVSEELLKVIETELPVILNSLDLESLVKNKVNDLPIEEVEELILKLINEELKYITLMGGVLGFLIGALQIFLV